MINAHNGPQVGSCFPPYVTGNTTTTRKDWHDTRSKAGEALGVYRIRSCRLSTNSIFWQRASAVKWL